MRAALVLLTACWTSSSPPPPPSPEPPPHRIAPPPLAERPPLPAHTMWGGSYQCAQGWTAVQLTLDVDADGTATAIFDFGALANNPTVPSGSYRMTGTADDAGDALVVRLVPDRWILQPSGYVMVALEATSDRDRRRLRGMIRDPGCSTLDVERID